MSNIQKIIKYLAFAFAFLLIFNIFSGIMFGIVTLGSIFNDKDNYEVTKGLKRLVINEEVKIIDVDVSNSNMIVKIGDTFKIETSNKYIECKQDSDKLYIREKSHNWFNNNDNSNLIIYVPRNVILDEVDINSGVGKIKIEELSTKILNLDLGAGNVSVNNLTVLNRTEIDGGAGEVVIDNSSFNNLDLSMGVGEFVLTAKLSGNSEIDHGVGKAKLNLISSLDDYQINIDKGLGSAIIDGKEIKDNETIGNGISRIDIDGGVGSINIAFVN